MRNKTNKYKFMISFLILISFVYQVCGMKWCESIQGNKYLLYCIEEKQTQSCIQRHFRIDKNERNKTMIIFDDNVEKHQLIIECDKDYSNYTFQFETKRVLKSATYSGSYGSSVTWKVDTSTKTLTLSGSGATNDYSFQDSSTPCNKYSSYIQKIIVSSGITYLGGNSLQGCKEVTSISLPNTLKTIGYSAFEESYKLTTITIPKSVTYISSAVFYSCNSLKSISMSDNGYYKTVDGVLYNSKQTILKVFPMKHSASFTIPSTITKIEEFSFNGCPIETVNVPNRVTSIGQWAFRWGQSKTITLPSTVTSIGEQAFSENEVLTSFIFKGKNQPSCPTNVFDNTKLLSKVSVPKGYTANVFCGKSVSCPAGCYLSSGCKKCSAGYYSKAGSSSCTKCSAGYYSGSGATSCSKCAAGTYSGSGAGSCINCPAGKYSASGSSSCTNCPSGTYSGTRAGSCTNCPAGKYQGSTGQSTCNTCSAGYYSGVKSISCSQCKINTYTTSTGSSGCTACSTTCRTVSSTESRCNFKTGVCVSCDVGKYINGKECTACPVGKYSNTNTATSCISCTAKTYQDKTGQTSCIPCDTNCEVCTATTGVCTKCKAGYEPNGKSCNQCSAGQYSDSNENGKCKSCPAGTYNNQVKQTSCPSCPDRQYQTSTGKQSCINCSIYCVSKICSKTTGKCDNCVGGYEKGGSAIHGCVICSAGYYSKDNDNECKQCPEGSISTKEASTTCVQCTGLTYSNENRTNCDKCTDNCVLCQNTDGKCLKCSSGYGLDTTNNKCIQCQKGEYSDGSVLCQQCSTLMYQDQIGQASCKSCNAICSSCDRTTGKCLTCDPGYSFDSTKPMPSTCSICKDGEYSKGGTSRCLTCPACNVTCDKTTSYCNICPFGQRSIKGTCKSCSENDNCFDCNKNGADQTNWTCKQCKEEHYLDLKLNECLLCPNITHCVTCSQTEKRCTKCSNQFVPQEEECKECLPTHYKYSETECKQCASLFPHCHTCQLNDNANYTKGAICLECYYPYELSSDGKSCLECVNGFDENTKKCIELPEGTLKMTNNETSIECSDEYVLRDNKCTKIEGTCFRQRKSTCEYCENEYIITQSNQCNNNEQNCVYEEDNKCLICKQQYVNDTNGKCIEYKSNDCYYFYDNKCYYSKEGYYNSIYSEDYSKSKTCDKSTHCQEYNGIKYDFNCKNTNEYIGNQTHECKSISEETICSEIKDNYCMKTIDGYHIEKGDIVKNEQICVKQQREICLKCQGENMIVVQGKCFDIQQIHCSNITNKRCYECEERRYLDEEGCIERKGSEYENCTINNLNSKGCYSCKDEYYLTNDFQCVSIEKENELKRETNEEDNCLIKSIIGCLRCKDGWYLEGRECKQCDERKCEKCVTNSTTCIVCNEYTYLSGTECKEINEGAIGCKTMMPLNKGCLQCQDGYHKTSSGKECQKCHESCSTCMNDNDCVDCNTTYWRKPGTSGLCKPFDTLTNCLPMNITQQGCTECEIGSYLYEYECYKCNENCTSCQNEQRCNSCKEGFVLTDNSECLHYTIIENCISVSESKCTQCIEGFKLNDKHNGCVELNTALIIGLTTGIGSIFFIIIFITIICVIVIILVQRRKEYDKIKDLTFFKINDGTHMFFDLEDISIVTNKTEIDFNIEEDEIPVFEESSEYICIGNKSRNRMKVQFTTKEGCDKYEIRTEPQIVSLRKGEACEFEIFIKPLCSCQLEDEIRLIILDIKEGKERQLPMKISIKTKPSTRLDYDEIHLERKLGEGSFGVVYLGEYRGNKVAIKKMKNLVEGDEERAMVEFNREVDMLDKFRCDYIVHFYGAVMIPTKICMVTEFAEYGSLSDLIKKIRTVEQQPSELLRIKFLSDASKGIEYLHQNGILHRDIKPDNFLVVSLDEKEKVNCKLTDFGSARNINQMMTNMTFTKGIGTPAYMAPEVLNRKKYKKQSDVYSFSITMLEVMIWGDVYPKQIFKYAWTIADDVTSGKRPQTIELVHNKDMKRLIEQSWCQEPRDRLKIEDIVSLLETIVLKMK